MKSLVTVHCSVPGCTATAELPRARDVYPDDALFHPDQPVDCVQAGWTGQPGYNTAYYFCPEHGSEPARFDAACKAHDRACTAAVKAFTAAWEEAHPGPTLAGFGWVPWAPEASP
jgi:hypothetical protein